MFRYNFTFEGPDSGAAASGAAASGKAYGTASTGVCSCAATSGSTGKVSATVSGTASSTFSGAATALTEASGTATTEAASCFGTGTEQGGLQWQPSQHSTGLVFESQQKNHVALKAGAMCKWKDLVGYPCKTQFIK